MLRNCENGAKIFEFVAKNGKCLWRHKDLSLNVDQKHICGFEQVRQKRQSNWIIDYILWEGGELCRLSKKGCGNSTAYYMQTIRRSVVLMRALLLITRFNYLSSIILI